jgi:hypothetical protein
VLSRIEDIACRPEMNGGMSPSSITTWDLLQSLHGGGSGVCVPDDMARCVAQGIFLAVDRASQDVVNAGWKPGSIRFVIHDRAPPAR